MRLVAAFLLAAVFMTGTAHAQPNGTSNYASTALQPNNCGTPDAPKAWCKERVETLCAGLAHHMIEVARGSGWPPCRRCASRSCGSSAPGCSRFDGA